MKNGNAVNIHITMRFFNEIPFAYKYKGHSKTPFGLVKLAKNANVELLMYFLRSKNRNVSVVNNKNSDSA